ncbi:hypothetical protein BFR57_02520 [Idiomarina sp. MD25a]|uniref:sulfotransferase n=1 Tax=Idiomarina sp. MD25a TaxID=1889913 RepID=UPI0008F96F69|nr:sulfotransferase [Idiomarina sp. MD25a]OIM99459.1 hypothetical protein BFR57_02520 [Idiomarina sp. MD25a]
MTKNLCLVLGAGRSGTSLLMHLMRALGVSVSKNLIPPKHHNPMGPMEDENLAQLFDRRILPENNMTRLLPFPKGKTLERRYSKEIEQILLRELESQPEATCFAFKDPVLSNFLPSLFPIFNSLDLSPKFVLCVRSPKSVIESRKNNFKNSSSLTELGWLTNTTNALKYTGGNVFIVHYEMLFTDARSEILMSLCNFLGIDDSSVEQAIDIIEPSLNRSQNNSVEIKNMHVKRLYKALRDANGVQFDREKILEVTEKCVIEMEGFDGWLNCAYDSVRQRNENRKLRDKYESLAKTLSSGEQELRVLRRVKRENDAAVHAITRIFGSNSQRGNTKS